MKLSNIYSIALYESRTLFRSWFFRIFAILSLLMLFGTTLLVILGTDMLKCFGAYKIKRFVTQRFIQWINWIAGAGLITFGIFLIISSFIKYYV